MSDEELVRAYRDELVSCQNHPGLVFRLQIVEAMALVAAVQLACRHEGFRRTT